VAEALRDDPLPLFLVCAGPLTNVAQALQQEPGIAQRLTLVWIGGALDPAAAEYNRDTDPKAAEFVVATPVLVTALDDESSSYRTTPNGRVYTGVDVRLLFADMLAKLRLHERRR
jgi:inosine-uridine nucleoside N-ribohydrolase